MYEVAVKRRGRILDAAEALITDRGCEKTPASSTVARTAPAT